jgi:hypothetical protein
MDVSGQFHTPASLSPNRNPPDRRLGISQVDLFTDLYLEVEKRP